MEKKEERTVAKLLKVGRRKKPGLGRNFDTSRDSRMKYLEHRRTLTRDSSVG